MPMGDCLSKCYNKESNQHAQQPEIDISSSNVHRITSTENWEAKLSEASKDGRLVVAAFSADWCGPCVSIIPTYCELANKFSCIMFLMVDVDDFAELSTSWDINATPTFFFLKDGRHVDKIVGANRSELQKKTATMAAIATKPRT